MPNRQQISWRTVLLQLSGSMMQRCIQRTAPLPLTPDPPRRQQSSMPTPASLQQPLQEPGRRSAKQQRLRVNQQQVQQQRQMSRKLLTPERTARHCHRQSDLRSRLRRAGRFPVTHPLPLPLRARSPLPGAAPGPLAQRCAGCRCRLLPCDLASQVRWCTARGHLRYQSAVMVSSSPSASVEMESKLRASTSALQTMSEVL